MRKKDILKALESFSDDDHIMIGGKAWSYTPDFTAVCGKGQKYMPYFCVRAPDHDGECYCSCKNIDFIPD